MIRLFEMFAGYGGASFGLKKANIEFECVGISEIDKYAWKCFTQNHQGYNYGDCSKINTDELPDLDLLTGGFPCQDVSIAGKRKLEKGRTNLYLEIIRIAKAKKPKYMLLENVKGLLSMEINERSLVNKIVADLQKIGYGVCWKVLNSKDYGIPQNRERIWFVCKLGGWDFAEFQFPQKRELKMCLQDVLEPEKDIDGKYYLSEKQTKHLMESNDLNKKFSYLNPKIAGTQTTRQYASWRGNFVSVGMINQTCKKRTFDTPKEINQYLKSHKGNHTIKEISDYLEMPKTQVEHYFRTDNSRAIPDVLTWFELKKLLGFDETWDTEVATIHEKEITFESTRRVYSAEGVSPTISSANADKIIQINNPKHSNDRVYSPNGLAPTLNTMNGGNRQPLIYQRARGNNNGGFKEVCPTINSSKFQDNNLLVQPVLTPDRPNKRQNGRRFKEDGEPMFTLTGQDKHGVLINNSIIRKLTPKECFRLMGFLDDEINLDDISNSRRYSLAGNGWDINLVSKIFKRMFPLGREGETK